MGKYICINCGECFKQKSHYEKHLKKKKPCTSIQEKLNNIVKVTPDLKKNQFSQLSKDITKGLNTQTKKKNGIFFTPLNIIEDTIMTVAKYCENNNKTIKRILEPSCGSCEFIKRLSEHYEDVHIDGIEYVPEIFEKINKSEFSDKENIRLLNEDFLKVGNEMYDLIIGNPPYYVMKKTEVDKKYHEYFDGRPNIFVIFILHALSKLNPGGILSFVLPNSFCNCTYYNKLRVHLFENYNIIDIKDCSESSYLETAQNTVIFTISNEKGNNDEFSFIKNEINLLNAPSTINQITKLYQDTTTISELDLYVSVGKTVWNQVKEALTDDITETRLIYSGDIKGNKLQVTSYKNAEKKNYIRTKGETGPLLVVNRGYGVGGYKFDYCLVDIDQKYTIENHLITIRSSNKISDEELQEKYKLIIKSFENEKTQQFIDLYCCNSAMNTNELENVLPIYQ